MSIITKLDIGLINLINKASSTMDISIYNEEFWHSISKGGLYGNKQGKLICFQEEESPMINRDIVNSRIEIISDDFVFRLGSRDMDTLSIQIDKVV